MVGLWRPPKRSRPQDVALRKGCFPHLLDRFQGIVDLVPFGPAEGIWEVMEVGFEGMTKTGSFQPV